jgi:hypothetical protein
MNILGCRVSYLPRPRSRGGPGRPGLKQERGGLLLFGAGPLSAGPGPECRGRGVIEP